MMAQREILFRGKRLDNGEWVYGVPHHYGDGCFIASHSLESNNGKDWRIKAHEVDPKTIGQFTGLHDKSGKPIYEGDILQVPDNYDLYGFMAGEKREVIFNHGGFRFKPQGKNDKGYWLEDDKEFEIIGDIFSSPELLK